MRHLICQGAAAALAVCLTIASPVGRALADAAPAATAPAAPPATAPSAPSPDAPSGAPADAPATTPAPVSGDAPAPPSTSTPTDAPAPPSTDAPTNRPAAPSTGAPPPPASDATPPAPADGSAPATSDAPAASVMLDNSAVSVNTKDNTSVFHLAFTVVRSSGPDVSVSNVAVAVTDCSHCRSVAIAIQLAFVWPAPSALTATNLSVAVTSGCTTCDAFAAALQYVIASKDAMALTALGRSEVAQAEQQLRALQDPGLSPAALKASITGIADQLGNALATGVVLAPVGDDGRLQDPPPLAVGSVVPIPPIVAVPPIGPTSAPSRSDADVPHTSPAPATVAAGVGAPLPTSSASTSGATAERAVRSAAVPPPTGAAPRATHALAAPVGTDAPPSVGPSIAVSPSTGLLPGAQVTVSGAGFPARATVQLDECALPAAATLDPSRCSPVADSLLLTGTDGTVRATATIVSGAVGTAAGAACPAVPPATCALALVAVGSSAAEAAAPIAFAASVPPPPAHQAAPRPVPVARAVVQGDRPIAASRTDALVANPAVVVSRHGGSSRPWALGLIALVLVGALAGVGQACAGLRRPRRYGNDAGQAVVPAHEGRDE